MPAQQLQIRSEAEAIALGVAPEQLACWPLVSARAAATITAQHCTVATGIKTNHCAFHQSQQLAGFTAAATLCTHRPGVSARRLHIVRATLDGNPAARLATVAPWVEGRDLTKKPTPESNEVIVYTHTLCPYAHRVHLALLEKGVPFQLVHIDLAARPQWFTSLSGLVPLVEHPEGVFHRESLDICRWVDEHFDGSELLPTEPAERDAALRLMSRGASDFSNAGLTLLGGRTSGPWGIARKHTPEQLLAFKAQLDKLGALLNRHGGPFLLGKHISLVDFAYFPFAERFHIAVNEFCNYDMAAAEGGKIGAWLTAVRQAHHDGPSADPDDYRRALQRHMRMDFFDYDTYSAAALIPHARKLVAQKGDTTDTTS